MPGRTLNERSLYVAVPSWIADRAQNTGVAHGPRPASGGTSAVYIVVLFLLHPFFPTLLHYLLPTIHYSLFTLHPLYFAIGSLNPLLFPFITSVLSQGIY